jgi:hypothetical protein
LSSQTTDQVSISDEHANEWLVAHTGLAPLATACLLFMVVTTVD